MPKRKPAPEVGQVIGQRVRELRESQRMTQAQLADRLAEVGHSLGRATVAKIEGGAALAPGELTPSEHDMLSRARNISVKDTMALSVALSVAPMHLFIPVDDNERVRLTERVDVSAPGARAWVRGQVPLTVQDERTYFTNGPLSEWAQGAKPGIERVKQLVKALDVALGSGDRAEVANLLVDLDDELAVLKRRERVD